MSLKIAAANHVYNAGKGVWDDNDVLLERVDI